MELNRFEKIGMTGLFAIETVWTKNNIEIIKVDPNDSSIRFVELHLNYSEFCDLVDKLCHLKKRLRKHHHNGFGAIGKRNKIKKQIEELQQQLKELDDV